MCDILYVPPTASYSGHTVFAKNSDREPDEAQVIEYVPRQVHSATTLNCTFITIPQVRETYACILSRPFQMWGAEMGVNEYGVVIGNEAVFTRIKFRRDNSGLTGMDMLRLALERSKSAPEALQCIVHLLETYGQDACGGYRNKRFFYHNSFLIADATEAFVLETAGKHWAVEKVEAIRSLSNCLSIYQADELSREAERFARTKKWINQNEPFRFAKAYSDRLFTRLGRGAKRAATTCTLASGVQRPVSVVDCIKILQTHNLPEHQFKPSRATTASVCMHATGLLNPSETTGSMVAEIRRDKPHTVWLTGTPHPCLSVYIPFFISGSAPSKTTSLFGKLDDSLWHAARAVHRWIGSNYQVRKPVIEADRQKLQNRFLEHETRLIGGYASTEELQNFTFQCIHEVRNMYAKWLHRIRPPLATTWFN
jgi:dipeptidase